MEASQMAVVNQIQEIIEQVIKEFGTLGEDLRNINQKLLPSEPGNKESEQPTCEPQGWFEQILQRIRHLRDMIIEIKIHEARRLKNAVAAGQVKRAE